MLRSQAIDGQSNFVSLGQVGESAREGNAFGRTSEDDVPQLQHGNLTEISGDVCDAENHVLGAGILPHVAVYPRLKPQLTGDDVRRGENAGTERQKAWPALTLRSLTTRHFKLPIAVG